VRTLLIHIDGEVEPGDKVILQCSDRYRGGQSNARADVPQPRKRIEEVNGHDTIVTMKTSLSDVIGMITRAINGQWGAGFSARQRNDNELIVQCESSSQEVNFHYTIEGSMKQTITIEDLA
jgi:hypothetical protein